VSEFKKAMKKLKKMDEMYQKGYVHTIFGWRKKL
jgi:hypothetical protein